MSYRGRRRFIPEAHPSASAVLMLVLIGVATGCSKSEPAPTPYYGTRIEAELKLELVLADGSTS